MCSRVCICRARTYGWQDTYVFTKAMGEMMINKMRGDVPVVIIRPSVIESTFKEPFPGWMEGNRFLSRVIIQSNSTQPLCFNIFKKKNARNKFILTFIFQLM